MWINISIFDVQSRANLYCFSTNMIYLDNAATTKVSNEVVDEMLKYFSVEYGNPSSKHSFGQSLKKIVDQSREKVSALINAEEDEIFFTSGATEAINIALRGYVEANIESGNHIITSKVEHKAVLETCKYLESVGLDVTYLDVDENGMINLQELENSIKPETILVSLLWINNETGIFQDLNSISTIVNRFNSKLFIDATQAVGKIPVDVITLGIDMLCLSAHKFYGPKGVGALYVKSGIKIKPLVYGGGQEKGIRSGTTNVPGIVGLAKACEISTSENANVKEVKAYLEKNILEKFDCEVIGFNSERSPYISNVIFNGVNADVVIGQLENTVVSTGSACNSEINEPSHVLKYMGIEDQKAYGSIRFSLSNKTSTDDINSAIKELQKFI